MPLITIWNWPVEMFSGENWRAEAAYSLRAACVAADIPNVDSTQISVCFSGPRQIREDRTLIIIVDLLFDLPERSDELRQQLAENLHQAMRQVIIKIQKANLHPNEPHLSNPALGGKWNVEVAVKRFDPVTDGFCS